MPIMPLPVLGQEVSLADLCNEVAKLQKTVNYLTGGQLDFDNIRVKGIVADNIDVAQLSAISADIGTITAGIIRGIEIYGSYIATAEGTYPRSEMDVAGNFFAAYASATNFLKILANVAGAPRISMSDGVHSANMTLLSFFGATAFGISADDCNLYLLTDPGFNVVVPDWSQLYSTANVQSLQTALDNLTAAINANTAAIATKATSGASTGSAGSANGGIAPGTVLMVSGGGTVTWNGIPSHSHSQS